MSLLIHPGGIYKHVFIHLIILATHPFLPLSFRPPPSTDSCHHSSSYLSLSLSLYLTAPQNSGFFSTPALVSPPHLNPVSLLGSFWEVLFWPSEELEFSHLGRCAHKLHEGALAEDHWVIVYCILAEHPPDCLRVFWVTSREWHWGELGCSFREVWEVSLRGEVWAGVLWLLKFLLSLAFPQCWIGLIWGWFVVVVVKLVETKWKKVSLELARLKGSSLSGYIPLEGVKLISALKKIQRTRVVGGTPGILLLLKDLVVATTKWPEVWLLELAHLWGYSSLRSGDIHRESGGLKRAWS